MIKNIYDYFQNLENEKLKTSQGTIIYDDKKIILPSKSSLEELQGTENSLVYILNKPYYLKDNFGKMSIVDIASSQMYNDIGLPTPPVHMIDIPTKPNIQIATQDVNSTNGLIFTIAHSSIVEREVFSYAKERNNKWDNMYDTFIQEELLKYMTTQCLEQLNTLHLLDETRTEGDRHLGNYFFYKSPDSDKYEGVLPIDNEFARIVFDYVRTADDFKYFLNRRYASPTVLCSRDYRSLKERMDNIKQLIYDNKLSRNQIDILKRELNYDLPAKIKGIKTSPYLKPEKNIAYDGMARLWEYHHGNDGIEKEL